MVARLVMPARHNGIAVVCGAALLLGTLICGSALVLKNARQTALHAAEMRLQNSASVVTNGINRQLLQVDGALVSLPSLFAAVDGDQKTEIDPNLAGRLLRAFNFETFSFRDLLLVRPDGTVWAAARPRPRNLLLPLTPPDASAASFPGATAVEGPIYNPTTGDWSLYLARPISLRGAGRLQSVAEVPLPSIMALLAPAGAVPGMRIYIERPDGLRLASLPQDELKVGKKQAAAISSLGSDSIAFNLPSWLIPSPNIAVWRNTLYPDVQVALTLDLSAALADWTRDRDRLLMALGVACLLVLALAGALHAALRQHERVEAERKTSRDLLDGAIEAMSDGFVMWDEQDRLVTCNQRFRDLYTISAPFIRPGARFEDIIREGAKRGQYPQAGDDIDEFVRETIEWHHGHKGLLERLLPDGKWIQITERHNPTGGIVGIRTDITVLKQAMTDLAAANERAGLAIEEARLQNVVLSERDQELRVRNMLFTAALNNMSQGLLMVDSNRRVIVCNKRFHDIFHISESNAFPGVTAMALFRAIEDEEGLNARAIESIYRQQEEFAASPRSGVFVNADDEKLALSISQRPLPDGGWIATYEDVTEQQRSESRIRFMAHYDSLTGLPNRSLFHTQLTEAIGQLSDGGNDLALLYIDLDRFKFVNDSLGHSAGDAVLEIVARRLQGCVRDADLVARLGGDEFAVLYATRDLPMAVTAQAERVIEVLSEPYQLGQRQIDLGVSIGIAVATDGTMDGDKLLRNADMALYQAKFRGRGTYCVFEPEMESTLHARLAIEADLRAALEREQFEVFYQPLVDLRSNRLCGFEALLRWNHPMRGLLLPGQFIPLAEELGVIKSIGAWVLRQACGDAVRFFNTAKIAVNLSPVQLEDDEVFGTVSAALSASGLDPARLEIEITESALLNKSERTIAQLRRLHDLGVSIALDDFGTGYSSLSYLRSFPFDSIKIDRLFISEMATREDCTAIVRAIVDLAKRLGITTTAEGVETDEQLRLVSDLGCTAVQGYLIGRPQPIRKVIEYVEATSKKTTVRGDAPLRSKSEKASHRNQRPESDGSICTE
jgi:diguanylate cyclase (GGDEF)-like protein